MRVFGKRTDGKITGSFDAPRIIRNRFIEFSSRDWMARRGEEKSSSTE